MENEVSHTFELGVSLMAIAVVIGVIIATVTFGKGIKDDAFNWLAHSNKQVSEGTLASLNGVSTELPSAGAYNILKTYSSLIEKTECHIDGCKEVTEGLGSEPCIAKHLNGKVSLDIRKANSGNYTVEIHEDWCKWYSANCTCR